MVWDSPLTLYKIYENLSKLTIESCNKHLTNFCKVFRKTIVHKCLSNTALPPLSMLVDIDCPTLPIMQEGAGDSNSAVHMCNREMSLNVIWACGEATPACVLAMADYYLDYYWGYNSKHRRFPVEWHSLWSRNLLSREAHGSEDMLAASARMTPLFSNGLFSKTFFSADIAEGPWGPHIQGVPGIPATMAFNSRSKRVVSWYMLHL